MAQFAGVEDQTLGFQKNMYVGAPDPVAMENVAVATGDFGVAHHEGAAAVEPINQQSYPPYGSYQQPPTDTYNYNTAGLVSPPPYYPQQPPVPIVQPPSLQLAPETQAQQSQEVKVVVKNQPQVVQVHHNQPGGTSDFGTGAMIFAIVVTAFIGFCLCWWSLTCTIPAIVFAVNATSAGTKGDLPSVRTNNNLSIGCSVAGIVSTVVGVLVIVFGPVIFIFAVSSSQ